VNIEINIPEEAWEQTGGLEDVDDPASMLSLRDTLLINGAHFHAEAIAVHEVSEDSLVHLIAGTTHKADNPALEDDLDRVCGILGDAPQPITIRGRLYVLVIIPYAE
jgi:hypothetical protein